MAGHTQQLCRDWTIRTITVRYLKPNCLQHKYIQQRQKLSYTTSNVTSVTEIRSASARLFDDTWRPLVGVITTLLCCDDFSSSSVASRAFSVLCVYSQFGHHPYPSQATFVSNFVSYAASVAELAHGEKSRTQYSINHPAYLMPREPKRLRFGITASQHLSNNKTMHKSR